jgi:guanylate kinase
MSKPPSTPMSKPMSKPKNSIEPMSIQRRGLMLVLSSPSGAGKTTISRALLKREPELTMSVSATTRPKRPGETAGVDYTFIDPTEFNLMVNRREMLEHAQVFGNYYGTPRKPVDEALTRGRDVLFDIDWQGTQQIAQVMMEDLVRIFILPPSSDELQNRLINRAQDSSTVVAKRMAEASNEISHWAEYDYVIVNDELEDSHAQVTAILTAERLRRRRRIGLTEFVRGLTKGL